MQSFENHFFGNIISAYTREQAIDDGVLIDVTTTARTIGFTIPVAITAQAWSACVEWCDSDNDGQTRQGRLCDVLSMLYFAIRKNRDTDCLLYRLYIVPRDDKARRAKLTTLKAQIGAGDSGEPVITIMLPNED